MVLVAARDRGFLFCLCLCLCSSIALFALSRCVSLSLSRFHVLLCPLPSFLGLVLIVDVQPCGGSNDGSYGTDWLYNSGKWPSSFVGAAYPQMLDLTVWEGMGAPVRDAGSCCPSFFWLLWLLAPLSRRPPPRSSPTPPSLLLALLVLFMPAAPSVERAKSRLQQLRVSVTQRCPAGQQGKEYEHDNVMLGRAGWAGSQKYGGAVWSGDTQSTWHDVMPCASSMHCHCLRSSLRSGFRFEFDGVVVSVQPAVQGRAQHGHERNPVLDDVSFLCLSPRFHRAGCLFICRSFADEATAAHRDIGGFGGGDTTSADFRELIVRWFQWGAFCPLFRLHGTPPPHPPGLQINIQAWVFGMSWCNLTLSLGGCRRSEGADLAAGAGRCLWGECGE